MLKPTLHKTTDALHKSCSPRPSDDQLAAENLPKNTLLTTPPAPPPFLSVQQCFPGNTRRASTRAVTQMEVCSQPGMTGLSSAVITTFWPRRVEVQRDGEIAKGRARFGLILPMCTRVRSTRSGPLGTQTVQSAPETVQNVE